MSAWNRMAKRWARSAPTHTDRTRAHALLRGARDHVRAGRILDAEDWYTQAHTAARNQVLTHVLAHAGAAGVAIMQGQLPHASRQLQLALMAPVGSLVRRAAGLAPDELGGDSLLATWGMRWREGG